MNTYHDAPVFLFFTLLQAFQFGMDCDTTLSAAESLVQCVIIICSH